MKKFIKEGWLSYSFCIITWLICIYPCIFFYDYFYLDTPYIERDAKGIFYDLSWFNPHDVSGRFIPVYKFFNGLLYTLTEKNISGMFIGQMLFILICAFLVTYISYTLTKNKFISIIAAVSFFVNSPISENAYTVGKPEVLLLFFILVLCSRYLKQIEEDLKEGNRLSFMAINAILVVLAIWTKETAISYIIVGITYLLIQVLNLIVLKKGDKGKIYTSFFYTFSIIIGIIISKIPGLIVPNPFKANYYTNYPITYELIVNNLHYYIAQQPDIIVFGVFDVLLSVFLLYQCVKTKNILSVIEEFSITITAFGWAYVCGMLLWRWPVGYYLLVPSVIFKITFIYYLYNFYYKINKKVIFLTVSSMVFVLLNIYGICYNYYIANTQIEMTKLYSDVINQYINIANPNSRLIAEQWSFYVEPVYESNYLINNIRGINNLKVDGLNDIISNENITDQIKELYRLKDIPDKDERMPVNGDYVVIISGNKPSNWCLRGVTPISKYSSKLLEYGYDMELIGQKEYSDKSIIYNKSDHKIAWQKTSLEYKLYKVNNNYPHIMWSNNYEDGWIGREASVQICPKKGEQNININFSVPKENLPLTIDIEEAGNKVNSMYIDDTNMKQLVFETSSGKEVYNYKIILNKTFIPKEKGINSDTRELGLLIKNN